MNKTPLGDAVRISVIKRKHPERVRGWSLLVVLRGAVFGALVQVQAQAADDSIILMFDQRAPYSYMDDNNVVGTNVTPVEAALHLANIKHKWQSTPPQQQLQALKANKDRLCAVGWYETAERRSYLHVSAPIAQDGHYVIIARANDARFSAPVDLAWLQTQPVYLARSLGLSYGTDLDSLIAAHKLASQEFRGDDSELLANILHNRADYALILSEEVDALLAGIGNKKVQIQQLAVTGFPEPQWTHMLCTRMIDRATMLAIDNALRAVLAQSSAPPNESP